MLRQKQHELTLKRLESGELFSGKGKNQETSLTRPGDTRWVHIIEQYFVFF